jgi:hypothetical protein
MRKILILGLMALAFLVGSVSLTAASANDDDHDDDGTHHFTAVSNQFKEFDTGKKGPSIGDYFVFSDRVFKDSKKVGSLDGVCALTHVRKASFHEHCNVTMVLPEGQLTVQGVIVFDKHFADKFTIAVTGGTGDYAGAEGEAHVEFLSETRTSIEVNLD